jgi:hypothetical protein
VLAEWFVRAAKEPSKKQRKPEKKSVIVNTNKLLGLHWIKCVFMLPYWAGSKLVKGTACFLDGLITTRVSDHVKKHFDSQADINTVTELRATGEQDDGWSCGYFCLLWLMLSLLTGCEMDQVRTRELLTDRERYV